MISETIPIKETKDSDKTSLDSAVQEFLGIAEYLRNKKTETLTATQLRKAIPMLKKHLYNIKESKHIYLLKMEDI